MSAEDKVREYFNAKLKAIADIISNPEMNENSKMMVLVHDLNIPRDIAKKLVGTK